jgi:hypothetical protein
MHDYVGHHKHNGSEFTPAVSPREKNPKKQTIKNKQNTTHHLVFGNSSSNAI